jgi:hypothetical protein
MFFFNLFIFIKIKNKKKMIKDIKNGNKRRYPFDA